MKIKKIVFAISALAVFVIIVFGFKNASSSLANDINPALQDTTITGQELYRENCAGCHGVNRQGTPPKFPMLLKVKENMTKEQFVDSVKKGNVLMHSFAYLPDNELNAIASYLFEEDRANAVIKTSSMIALGKNLVMSNCLSCHHLTVNDPVPASAKTLCPLIEPSALVGEKTKLSKEQFMLILKKGPCYMPSFDFLNAKDKEAIWMFLSSLKEKAK